MIRHLRRRKGADLKLIEMSDRVAKMRPNPAEAPALTTTEKVELRGLLLKACGRL